MKKILTFLVLLATLSAHSQDHAVMYSVSTETYLGMGYMRIGEGFALGLNLRSNVGTWNAISQTDEFEMDEFEILDDGEYSWQYNDEYEYDRASFTGRLYLRIAEKEYSSNWIYFGLGPGWVRHYYGYRWSGSDESLLVLDTTQSISGTEWEAGFMHMSDTFMWAFGLTSLNFKENLALTLCLGIPF